MPHIYNECRRIALHQLRREHRDHTLDPTGLVHEAYLRMVDQRHATWENRAQFFGVVARVMRRVLVDYARAQHAEKRGGSTVLVSLREAAQESRRRLVPALNAARMGAWDWNIATGEVRWSGELEPLHGLPRGGFWREIGRGFGVTAQSAHQRFGAEAA